MELGPMLIKKHKEKLWIAIFLVAFAVFAICSSYGIGVVFMGSGGGVEPPPEPTGFLQLEDGSYLLLEDGGKIILEATE